MIGRKRKPSPKFENLTKGPETVREVYEAVLSAEDDVEGAEHTLHTKEGQLSELSRIAENQRERTEVRLKAIDQMATLTGTKTAAASQDLARLSTEQLCQEFEEVVIPTLHALGYKAKLHD